MIGYHKDEKMETIRRIKIIDVLKREDYGSEVNVKGWVRTRRGSKSVHFIALNDGSTINNVQVVADADKFDDELIKLITTGACLSVTGELVQSVGSGQAVEIQAREIEVLVRAARIIRCRRKGRAWNICVRMPTCVCVPIRSVRCSVSVITWRWPSIVISMNMAFSISIRRLLRAATAKEPDRCFR